jgi:hypothetical protein
VDEDLVEGLFLFNVFINEIDRLLHLRDAYAHIHMDVIYTREGNERRPFFRNISKGDDPSLMMPEKRRQSKLEITSQMALLVKGLL